MASNRRHHEREDNESDHRQPSAKRPAMMTTSSGVSGSVLKQLTCSICLQLYDTPKHLPSCPHSFCLACLDRLPKTKDEQGLSYLIRCPQCQTNNILGDGGVQDLQTNFALKEVVEAIKAEQKQHKTQPDVDEQCGHAFSDDPDQSTCPHCHKQFCQSCRFLHMERLKVEAVQAANQVIEKCEELDPEKTSTDLRKAVNEAINSTETLINELATKFRTTFESSIARSISAYQTKLQVVRDQNLAILLENVQQLVAKNNTATLKESLDEMRVGSVLHQDMAKIAKFHQAVQEREKALVTIKKLIEQPRPLQLRASPVVEKAVETIGSSEFCVVVGAAELIHPTPLATLIQTPNVNALDHQSSATQIMPDVRNNNEHLTAPAPEAILDASVPKQVPGQWVTVQIGNAKSITAVKKKGLFVVLHGKDGVTCLDRSGRIISDAKASIPPDYGKNAKVGYVACGDGGLAYFTVNADDTTYRGVSVSQLDLTTPAQPAIKWLFKTNYAKEGESGTVVVGPWNAALTYGGSSLVGYMPMDTENPERFTVAENAVDLAVHGLTQVSHESCRLLCSTQGRLAVVPIELLPKNKQKKFRCSGILAQNMLQFPWPIDARKDPIFLFHCETVLAVVVKSRLQIFELCYGSLSQPKLIAEFAHAALDDCKAVAVLQDSASLDKDAKFTVGVVTSSKAVRVFQVPVDCRRW